MIDQIINDINNALQNGAYLSALALALTLPDVCGIAAYSDNCVRNRYTRWYDEHIGKYETDGSSKCPYLSGEVVYSLRNCFLHQATPNIKSSKANIGKFVLVIEPKNEFDVYFDMSSDDDLFGKEYHVNIHRLCFLLTRAASAYYAENKDRFSFINFNIASQ